MTDFVIVCSWFSGFDNRVSSDLSIYFIYSILKKACLAQNSRRDLRCDFKKNQMPPSKLKDFNFYWTKCTLQDIG
jgi:hypothetical protein